VVAITGGAFIFFLFTGIIFWLALWGTTFSLSLKEKKRDTDGGAHLLFFFFKFFFFFVFSLFLGYFNHQEAVLGMVMGSFLVVFLLVAGVLATLRGPLHLRGQFWYQKLWGEFLLVSLPLLFLMDKRLSRLEGLILFVLGVAFFFISFRDRFSSFSFPKIKGGIFILSFWAIFVLLLFWFFFLNISSFSFRQGLFFLSFLLGGGEVILNLKKGTLARWRFTFDRLFDDLVFMALIILGLTGIIFPFAVQDLGAYLLSNLFFLLAFLLFLFFSWTKRRIDFFEGLLLVLVFILMVLVIA